MTEVLALRALGLGDLLTSVAALRGLRRAWPGARLVLAAPAALGAWLAHQGVVDDVVAVRGLGDGRVLAARGGRPDIAVNLHGRGPQSHRLLAEVPADRLVAYACPEAGVEDGPSWRPEEHEVDRWVRLARWAGGDAEPSDLRLPAPGDRLGHVVLHPGAAAASRQWPPERWAAVAGALAAEGHRVVVTGTAPEAGLADAVVSRTPGAENACGLLDLTALGELVGTAALLLSADTGVAHLATAFGTPSVTLFGPVSPQLWGPRIDEQLHRVLWRPLPGDAGPGDPHGTTPDPRLLAVEVPEVVVAAQDLLGLRVT